FHRHILRYRNARAGGVAADVEETEHDDADPGSGRSPERLRHGSHRWHDHRPRYRQSRYRGASKDFHRAVQYSDADLEFVAGVAAHAALGSPGTRRPAQSGVGP